MTDAWSSYWQGEAGASLAGLDAATAALLDAPWHDLARSLPRNAQLLDLASGGGAVLRLLRRARGDLKLTGVDAAGGLPKLPGIRLIERVDIAALPLPDGRFDAVTSRFGIEYGDAAAAAGEAARVLRPGGVTVLLVHHAASAIVVHNSARLAALQWAWRESGLLARARALVRGRMVAPLPTPPAFREAPAEARRLFPGQEVAWEFATALLRTLDMGRGRPPAESLEVIDTLERRAEEEAARIAALLGAACDEAAAARLTDALTAGGIAPERREVVTGRDGAVLAWRIEGRR